MPRKKCKYFHCCFCSYRHNCRHPPPPPRHRHHSITIISITLIISSSTNTTTTCTHNATHSFGKNRFTILTMHLRNNVVFGTWCIIFDETYVAILSRSVLQFICCPRRTRTRGFLALLHISAFFL